MLQALGAVLIVVMLVVVFDIAGAQKAVIRYVTSKSLGSLAPGFAASRVGIMVYACLLGAFGLAVTGLGVAPFEPLLGGIAVLGGLVVFVALSVWAVVGEVRTYRALKR